MTMHDIAHHAPTVLACIRDVWRLFVERFKALWTDAVTHGRAGEACPPALFGSDACAGSTSLTVVPNAFLAVRFSVACCSASAR